MSQFTFLSRANTYQIFQGPASSIWNSAQMSFKIRRKNNCCGRLVGLLKVVLVGEQNGEGQKLPRAAASSCHSKLYQCLHKLL